MEEVRLNLASGKDYRKGFINIDNKSQYDGKFKVDKGADIITLKWKKNSVDTILCSHFAMYVRPSVMLKLVRRWYGWLKKGGKLYLETGNIYIVCMNILKAEDIFTLNGPDGISQLYGIDTSSGHKWGWTPSTMKNLFEQAGFKQIEVRPGYFHQKPKRDFLIIGTK